MKRFLRGIILGLALTSSLAHADAVVVFGLDRYNHRVEIPALLCAIPGQVLRLQADLLEYSDVLGVPAEYFTWRLTHRYGTYMDIWNPSWSPAYGPFERGVEPNAIYVSVPYDMGATGKLEVLSEPHFPMTIRLIDPRAYPYQRCYWAHPDVYLGG